MITDPVMFLITGSYDKTPFQVEVRTKNELKEKILHLQQKDARYVIWTPLKDVSDV